jgi:hypothetical protein
MGRMKVSTGRASRSEKERRAGAVGNLPRRAARHHPPKNFQSVRCREIAVADERDGFAALEGLDDADAAWARE